MPDSSIDSEDLDILRKRNRLKKRSPKLHKIAHESGRSTKSLWRQIIERAKK